MIASLGKSILVVVAFAAFCGLCAEPAAETSEQSVFWLKAISMIVFVGIVAGVQYFRGMRLSRGDK